MTFRSALLASAAILTAGSAFAADLPARGVAPAPYIAAPIFTWTGFYVGLNAGAAFNQGNSGVSTNVPIARPIYGFTNSNNNNDAGFTGGVTAGYNMQFGSFVAGVEGDINYLDRNNGNGGGGTFGVPVAAANTDFLVSRGGNSSNYFGTARARLGFAFDRFLVFGTGGFAFGGNNGNNATVFQRNNPAAPAPVGVPFALAGSGGSNSNVGYALGGGMEYAFSNSMSLKVEYLHVSLGGNRSTTFTTASGGVANPGYAGGEFITVNNKNKFDIVRAGVNFRF